MTGVLTLEGSRGTQPRGAQRVQPDLPRASGSAVMRSAARTECSMTPLQLLRDEHELEWFFSRGQIAFERSTFGGMLERAELFSAACHNPTPAELIHDRAGRVIGQRSAITARPTAELREQSGYVPDIQTLVRYAHVSMLMKLVERESRQASQVLELLYGDLGQRWAPTDPHGRIGALFHITVKGRKLLDTTDNPLELSSVKRMWNLVVVGSVQRNAELAQAIAYCQAQAQVLEQRARNVWLSVKQRNPHSKVA